MEKGKMLHARQPPILAQYLQYTRLSKNIVKINL
jgi:hypothetical protein